MLCEYCGKKFVSASTLFRHFRKNCRYAPEYKAPSKKPRLSDSLNVGPSLPLSDMLEPKIKNAVDRMRLNRSVISSEENGVEKLYCAFKNRLVSYRFKNINDHTDYADFLQEIEDAVSKVILNYMPIHHTLKVNFELFGLYAIPEKDLTDIKSFNTKNKVLTTSTDMKEVYATFCEEMLTKAADFQERDSGWTLVRALFLDVNINKFCPVSASSYIKLPKQIEAKRAVLNIKNNDNACFAWCINAAIFPAAGKPERTSSYPHYDSLLNFDKIEFPVKLKDIHRFEKLNNISVNVFGLDTQYTDGKMVTEVIGPLYFTSDRKPTHVNLLIISDDDGKTHYCLIKNLSRLVSSQISKYHSNTLHICDGCLQYFQSAQHLRTHQENDCNHTYTVTPTSDLRKNKCGELQPENILKFTNFEKQWPVPFVVYADFESLLKPIHYTEPSNTCSFTTKTYEHKPYSVGLYLKCNFDDTQSKYFSFRGSDCVEKFVAKLDQLAVDLYNAHLKIVKEMLPLTKHEEEEIFNTSKTCWMCRKVFLPDDIRVRDHCHVTSKFRGLAHQACNLNFKVPKYLPIFIHNLSYDTTLFIKKLACKGESISVIAQNKEKYVSFSKYVLVEKSTTPHIPDTYMKLRFVDSFRFLPRCLDSLSKNLKREQCGEVQKYFGEEKKFNLIRRKGVFPYSYVDSFQKLDETQLPSREQFFDTLSGETISEEDYCRAKDVWETFNCKTLGEYSDVYLKSDVLLLASVFEKFRSVCLEKYKLDPAHYLTAPSLSWDAMLRLTDVNLELLVDIDQLHFFRNAVRGGVSQCSKRKSIANNKFLPGYDSSKPTSYILCLDITNLYGAAMETCLPKGNFRWLDKNEIENFDCTSIADDSSKGYVLEVDLEYPRHLHSSHNDLPFCPESVVPPGSKYAKLIPNLWDKHNYVIHYRNLKQCLQYGLKLKKVHRILEFSQSTWLKPYIQLNTELRNSTTDPFERDLFKFLNNSVFGKTMENVDKRQDIKLCTNWENKRGSVGARHLIAKPHFKSRSIFSENLVAVQMEKTKVIYDKPLYVGFAILDISKTFVYEFFYGYIKKKYGNKAVLCYTDTDSLILEIFTENAYDDIKQNIDYFDTSNYTEPNIHEMVVSPSVIGKWKDEFAGAPVEFFYGTGSKAYCIKAIELLKKAKGITKHTIKNQLQLSDYIRTVEDGETIFRKMYVFTSELHNMYTELKNKVALSPKDDKRILLEDGITTLAHGHFTMDSSRELDILIAEAQDLINTSELENIQFDFDSALL